MSAPQQKAQKQFPFVAFAIGEGIGIVLGISSQCSRARISWPGPSSG